MHFPATEGSTTNSMAMGVDIIKNVCQVHYVDQASGEIVNKAIKRAKFLVHFANRERSLIRMEACGGRRATDLAGGTVAGQADSSEDRNAAGDVGAARDARAVGEVPHDADQRAA